MSQPTTTRRTLLQILAGVFIAPFGIKPQGRHPQPPAPRSRWLRELKIPAPVLPGPPPKVDCPVRFRAVYAEVHHGPVLVDLQFAGVQLLDCHDRVVVDSRYASDDEFRAAVGDLLGDYLVQGEGRKDVVG